MNNKYNQVQVCNLIGADKRTRFAMEKMFKSQQKEVSEWVEILKDFDIKYSNNMKNRFKENS